jgi:hypothetical protein
MHRMFALIVRGWIVPSPKLRRGPVAICLYVCSDSDFQNRPETSSARFTRRVGAPGRQTRRCVVLPSSAFSARLQHGHATRRDHCSAAPPATTGRSVFCLVDFRNMPSSAADMDNEIPARTSPPRKLPVLLLITPIA